MKVVLKDDKQLTTLGALAPGAVFKFVDHDYGLQMRMKTSDGKFVELESPYETYATDAYEYDEVVIYDATLQVSR